MKKILGILLLALSSLPVFVYADDPPATTPPATTPASSAYQFQRQGIFDCNQNGAYAMSVGAMSAIGGAYVPVADAVVELNTGILVYKECVLREVVNREREAALTAFLKQMENSIRTGRNGNPLYVQNEGKELVTSVQDPQFLSFLQDAALWNTVNPDLRAPLKRAAAQYYEGERSGLQATSLKCPYQGSLRGFQSGQPLASDTFFADFFAGSAPQCDPVIENFLLEDISNARIARATQYQMDQWNWGNGYYARTDNAQSPLLRTTLTPSYVVSQSFQQVLGSPVRQLENANDIGQMVGALYAGVTTQVVGDTSGLAGLAQSVGGQSSYLDQVAKESQQGLQGAATNAALQILNAQQQIEATYYQAVNGSGQQLLAAQSQLRAAENQCWAALIPKVCSSAPNAQNNCVANDGTQMKVATSTAFSQAVIAAQITPLIGPVTANIQNSQAALQLVSNLIQGIVNTASLDAQRVALQQLDSLVAQHQLHTQTDLQNASQQQQSLATTMSTLMQSVAQRWSGTGTDGTANLAWDGTTNPAIGWCNVNNSATLDAWTQKWKK